jgi:hypothetical protein
MPPTTPRRYTTQKPPERSRNSPQSHARGSGETAIFYFLREIFMPLTNEG